MTGWTCRRCSNGDHKACEQEVRGLTCICQCSVADDGWLNRKARFESGENPTGCLSCYFILCCDQCINHQCGLFSSHHKPIRM